jgi:hypothetical protein
MHIIALRAGTRFRQVDQGDIAKMAKAVGVVVMQVGRYDRDRQCREASNGAADVVIAGCTAVDQERTAIAGQQIFVIVGIGGGLADRPCARRNLLDTPMPVDNRSCGLAGQWPELRRIGRRRHDVRFERGSGHGQFGKGNRRQRNQQRRRTGSDCQPTNPFFPLHVTAPPHHRPSALAPPQDRRLLSTP